MNFLKESRVLKLPFTFTNIKTNALLAYVPLSCASHSSN